MRFVPLIVLCLFVLASSTSAEPERPFVYGDPILAELPGVGLLIEQVTEDAKKIVRVP